MKSIAAATLFVSVALAQSAALIPSGISSSCSSYLTQLNSDTTLTSCTSSLITATGAFAPALNATASLSNVSAVAAKSALAAVCAATTCSDTTIRSTLASFYSACEDELTTSQNADVLRTYDVLYALSPFKDAICSKDDNSNYCLTDITSTTSTSLSALSAIASAMTVPISSSLSRRADAQTVASIAPNTTTFAQNNLLFLMLTSTLSKDELCTTCTRNVLTSYISFESSTPYAPGLSSSALLSGQSDLYQAVTNTCGSTFLSGAVAAAAGLSSGILGDDSNGASRALLSSTGFAGAMVAAFALALGSAL